MDWISTVVGLTLVALIITATVLMMRHREKTRIAAREAESLNVISDDTRRAFWMSSADRGEIPDDFSSCGVGDDDE
jgi:hypothetical protein